MSAIPILFVVMWVVLVIVDGYLVHLWRRARDSARRSWSESATMLAQVRKLNEENRQRMRIATERWQKAIDVERRK